MSDFDELLNQRQQDLEEQRRAAAEAEAAERQEQEQGDARLRRELLQVGGQAWAALDRSSVQPEVRVVEPTKWFLFKPHKDAGLEQRYYDLGHFQIWEGGYLVPYLDAYMAPKEKPIDPSQLFEKLIDTHARLGYVMTSRSNGQIQYEDDRLHVRWSTGSRMTYRRHDADFVEWMAGLVAEAIDEAKS